jgi:hypothetical protein
MERDTIRTLQLGKAQVTQTLGTFPWLSINTGIEPVHNNLWMSALLVVLSTAYLSRT